MLWLTTVGVIQINFGSTFVDADAREKSDVVRDHLGKWMAERDLTMEDSAAQAYAKNVYAREPDLLDRTTGG